MCYMAAADCPLRASGCTNIIRKMTSDTTIKIRNGENKSKFKPNTGTGMTDLLTLELNKHE